MGRCALLRRAAGMGDGEERDREVRERRCESVDLRGETRDSVEYSLCPLGRRTCRRRVIFAMTSWAASASLSAADPLVVRPRERERVRVGVGDRQDRRCEKPSSSREERPAVSPKS